MHLGNKTKTSQATIRPTDRQGHWIGGKYWKDKICTPLKLSWLCYEERSLVFNMSWLVTKRKSGFAIRQQPTGFDTFLDTHKQWWISLSCTRHQAVSCCLVLFGLWPIIIIYYDIGYIESTWLNKESMSPQPEPELCAFCTCAFYFDTVAYYLHQHKAGD